MSPKAKTQEYAEVKVRECAGCHKPFHTRNPDAVICGTALCIARTTWSDDRWAGQLRMAEARAAAGVPFGLLDFDAYERAGMEVPW